MDEQVSQRRLRGAIVVTGNEVLAGRVSDRNGPWVSQALAGLGVEVAGIIQVGDRRSDLRRALEQTRTWGVDLVVTTGGLGPTADDLTVEVVADFQGRPLELDEALVQRVWERVEGVRKRFPELDEQSLLSSTRKQAMQPRGATPLEPVGTAPGSLVPGGSAGDPLVVVLPGPPRELQPMWEAAVLTDPLREMLSRVPPLEERMHRLVGLLESDLAGGLEAIRRDGVELDALEITTCMRSGEIEMVTRFGLAESAIFEAFDQGVRERFGSRLYSDDGASVQQVVRRELLARGWTVALAESCTGGMVASSLIDDSGASEYVRGGVVSYADDVKVDALGVDRALIETHGAVSAEVAEAMARGVVARLGADCGVAVTGIAGPGGGSEAKPVGTVWFGAVVPGSAVRLRRVVIPGDRSSVRERATVIALHVLRGALQAAG